MPLPAEFSLLPECFVEMPPGSQDLVYFCALLRQWRGELIAPGELVDEYYAPKSGRFWGLVESACALKPDQLSNFINSLPARVKVEKAQFGSTESKEEGGSKASLQNGGDQAVEEKSNTETAVRLKHSASFLDENDFAPLAESKLSRGGAPYPNDNVLIAAIAHLNGQKGASFVTGDVISKINYHKLKIGNVSGILKSLTKDTNRSKSRVEKGSKAGTYKITAAGIEHLRMVL